MCKQALISGAVDLTTQFSNTVCFLWLPKYRINKLGYLAREDYLDPLQLRVVTYMTNMYNMPCAPFIGMNRYRQSIQLG